MSKCCVRRSWTLASSFGTKVAMARARFVWQYCVIRSEEDVKVLENAPSRCPRCTWIHISDAGAAARSYRRDAGEKMGPNDYTELVRATMTMSCTVLCR